MAFWLMNWRKAEIMSLTADGTDGLSRYGRVMDDVLLVGGLGFARSTPGCR